MNMIYEIIKIAVEEKNMESNCCGALPIGETYDNLGFCSECREHAVFTEEKE